MIENVYELVRELNRFDQYFPEGMKDISFWHYTSADGLKGILTADGIRFWFTRSDCLNDESEGSGIFGVYEKKRNDWCDAHPEQADFADVQCSIDIPQERYLLFYSQDHLLDAQPTESDAYICSLSFSGDSLDMWRYYSKGIDGYALECAGNQASLLNCIHSIAKTGGEVILVGIVAPPLDQLSLAPVIPREINLITSFVYTPEEIEMYLDMLGSGKIAFPGMVTDIIALDECVEKGVACQDRKGQLKILIDPSK